jgi:two-component system OmpR family response regulator
MIAMKLLIVEDDKKIAAFLLKGMKEAGFSVDHASDGRKGLDLGMTQHYDAAVIDLMLPELDGLSLINRLRDNNMNIPVLILSAKRSVDERIKGLHAGGDDYLTKPFSFSELLARLQALVRRASKTTPPTRLIVGDLRLDFLSREVRRGDRKIELQAREFSLLECLMRNAGRVMSKTLILEQVWDYDFDPQTNVVDVLVCRLRNKIELGPEPKLIHTLRGVGYVLRQ